MTGVLASAPIAMDPTTCDPMRWKKSDEAKKASMLRADSPLDLYFPAQLSMINQLARHLKHSPAEHQRLPEFSI